MRQLTVIFILFLTLVSLNIPADCAVSGKVEYQIPIDYTKLSETELADKAGKYYNSAIKTSAGKVNEEMTTALNLYSILNNKNPENPLYPVRLGVLYDIAGKDKYAKGSFYKAVGINKFNPEPYYRLGNFYYRREMYKQALKNYKEAYKKGYDEHYETLLRIGDIYEKFGDTEASLRYLRTAFQISPNAELERKINKVKTLDAQNRVYYSDTRIRLIER